MPLHVQVKRTSDGDRVEVSLEVLEVEREVEDVCIGNSCLRDKLLMSVTLRAKNVVAPAV